MGWDWEESPWAFRRPDRHPVALAGGPNAAFGHATREGIRKREFARAVARRPDLEGVERVDRRAVFAVLKWGAKRNKDVSGYQRGIIKSVITAASTFQHQLAASGQADSGVCPFCNSGDIEDAAHAYWRCPA